MTIAEVMNREVVSLKPGDSIREAARLMSKSCVGSLPVLDENGSLVGMLTEADLLARLKPRRDAWFQQLLTDTRDLAWEYRKATGTTVAEVMRPAPVALQPDLPIESAAHVLSQDEIREVPVVLGGELVGRLGRNDLIRVLAQQPDPVTEARTDADLVADMQDQFAHEEWVSNRMLWIDAKNGVIALSGLVANEEERAALETMARAIAGCQGVEDHLIPRTAVRHVWA